MQKGAFGVDPKRQFEIMVRDPKSELYKKMFTSHLVQAMNIEGLKRAY